MASESEKSEGELLSEKLTFTPESCWENITQKEREEMFAFSEKYKAFLDTARTPYFFVDNCVSTFKECGFSDIKKFCGDGKMAKAGDGVYQTVKGKSLFLAVMGK